MRLIRTLASVVLLVSTTAIAQNGPRHTPPSAPGQNKLQCFDGTTDGGFGGICTISTKGAKGNPGAPGTAATLNNTDSNAAGDYAGVFGQSSTYSGQLLNKVTKLGYSYTGTTTPGPGDLSLNVPVDENNDGTTDNYAFIDAAYCPGVNGTVDIINDSVCGIYYGGSIYYPNWAAFLAAHPTWKVAADNVPFIVAERTPSEAPALWQVSNVTLTSLANGK